MAATQIPLTIVWPDLEDTLKLELPNHVTLINDSNK
jgi:hypothetical protein